ncbi:hypothetical protein FACS189418_0180 [Clostridia bacterium]|nr:hypothetical protein FACS189418_0180 [Clostridia bacterium]
MNRSRDRQWETIDYNSLYLDSRKYRRRKQKSGFFSQFCLIFMVFSLFIFGKTFTAFGQKLGFSKSGQEVFSEGEKGKTLAPVSKEISDTDRLAAALVSQEERALFLPEKYDYRLIDRAPNIKNQGILGTCWAFASLTAIETAVRGDFNFSEDHMSLSNSFGFSQNDGGEYTMSMAYLAAWQGPVWEKDDPYGDGYSPKNLQAVKHVQEMQIIPQKDHLAIKEAVYLQGGVQSSLYTSMRSTQDYSVYYHEKNYAYYYNGTESPNHDVVIVGWDDDYPKENFHIQPEGNGAFLCVNSWGKDFGDKGYFYVSYYDFNLGVHNLTYTKIEENDNYDKIYQSDYCGWIGQLGYGKDSAYFANVYTTEEKESLSAVGFYATDQYTEYSVYIARNVSDPKNMKNYEFLTSGTFRYAGFYTVELPESVLLNDNERFSVIVKITTPNSVHPVAVEYAGEDNRIKIDLSDGEGYISQSGKEWENIEESQQSNICLKAYTRKVETE